MIFQCNIILLQDDFENQDVTSIAKEMVSTVKQICGDVSNSSWGSNYTYNHIIDIFKGSLSKKVLQSGKINRCTRIRHPPGIYEILQP